MSFLNVTNGERRITELSQSGESFGGCKRAKHECGISLGSLLDVFFLTVLLNLMIIVRIAEQRTFLPSIFKNQVRV